MASITKVSDVVGSSELVTEEVVKSSLGWILGGNLQIIHHYYYYYYIIATNIITTNIIHYQHHRYHIINQGSNDFATSFWKCLVVILVTEIGDKTFFIAAVLAMRHGRLIGITIFLFIFDIQY